MRLLVVVIAACAAPLRIDPPPPDPPPPPELVVDFEVTPPPSVATRGDEERPVLDQPPEVKLRLGHYISHARGIGVTIDRTAELTGRHTAKLRYDGTTAIRMLDSEPGVAHRTDYFERRRVVLHVYDDGRHEIYVGGDGPIALRRDGDAEPL